jgi:hypothetical protein
MYDSTPIWNSYNDGDYIDDSYGDYTRSNAKIVAYWDDFKNKVNTKDPIYKWNCFNTVLSIKHYINEIADVLSSIRYSNAYSCDD